MKRKILVATDLSPRSAGVLPTAAAVARFQKAALLALHVVSPSGERGAGKPAERKGGGALRKAAQAALKRLTAQLRPHTRGISSVRCLVKAGRPGQVIADTARSLQAQWIVVGRGEGGRLGSNAERVVRTSGHTVVVVPTRHGSREASQAAPTRKRSVMRPIPAVAPRRVQRRKRAPRTVRR